MNKEKEKELKESAQKEAERKADEQKLKGAARDSYIAGFVDSVLYHYKEFELTQ